MPRDDDSFWISIFKRSPLIASLMLFGGLVGCGIGFLFFGDPRQMRSIRLIVCILFSFFCGGSFVGLVVGVIIDSVIQAIRGDKKNKRKRREWRGSFRE
jgi:pilus assembly protein TadC